MVVTSPIISVFIQFFVKIKIFDNSSWKYQTRDKMENFNFIINIVNKYFKIISLNPQSHKKFVKLKIILPFYSALESAIQ